jgi:nitrous oxide reductase accessory protein NosL
MRHIFASIIIILATFTFSFAEFSKTPSKNFSLLQQGEERHWCPVCGMNLKNFYKTNHAVKLKDGSHKQYCSIRCLVFDYEKVKDDIQSIMVVDAESENFIDAYKAFYVIGSKIPGTMTTTSKIAFSSETAANNFKKDYGGEIKTFNDTFEIAKENLNADIAFFKKKKEMMMYPMGEKIYNSVCKPIDLKNYKKINELKAALKANNFCGELDEKKAQAVALYLWEVKRFENNNVEQIQATHNDKCPVCGMFVYKYPNWVAEIKTDSTHFLFDGVKDMMKFYFFPDKYQKGFTRNSFTKILVTDYYTLKSIDAKKAYYVLGSRIYGPMGKELIPFVSPEDAKTFMADYGGSKILTFDEITFEILKSLDE